jgi:pimeloyl-ACP methyl ester carboxylesterase
MQARSDKQMTSSRLARITGTVIAGCAVVVLALAAWNFAVTQWRLSRTPRPGTYYDVDGRQMYIYCVGSGSPAVVIESGLSSDSLGWYGVQRELGKRTRVCAYDRSGLGLSEPRPGGRNAETIAQELHELLNQAGVQRPIVPLGWSAGGLYVREYARQFPKEIAGVALIESSFPRQLDALPGARDSYEAEKRELPKQYRWERLRVWTGWERVMGRCTNGPSRELVQSLPPDELARLTSLYVAKTCRPAFIGGEIGEVLGFDASTQEAARLTSFGQVPLLIMTEDADRRSKDATPSDAVEAAVWDREQEEQKRLSPLSWRVVARSSGHAMHHDRPDAVVAEMTRLIEYLRGGPMPPFGLTSRE